MCVTLSSRDVYVCVLFAFHGRLVNLAALIRQTCGSGEGGEEGGARLGEGGGGRRARSRPFSVKHHSFPSSLLCRPLYRCCPFLFAEAIFQSPRSRRRDKVRMECCTFRVSLSVFIHSMCSFDLRSCIRRARAPETHQSNALLQGHCCRHSLERETKTPPLFSPLKTPPPPSPPPPPSSLPYPPRLSLNFHGLLLSQTDEDSGKLTFSRLVCRPSQRRGGSTLTRRRASSGNMQIHRRYGNIRFL